MGRKGWEVIEGECRHLQLIVALQYRVKWFKMCFSKKMAHSMFTAHLDQGSSLSTPVHISRTRNFGHLDWMQGTVGDESCTTALEEVRCNIPSLHGACNGSH